MTNTIIQFQKSYVRSCLSAFVCARVCVCVCVCVCAYVFTWVNPACYYSIPGFHQRNVANYVVLDLRLFFKDDGSG